MKTSKTNSVDGKYKILYNPETKKTISECVSSDDKLKKLILFHNKKSGKSKSENIDKILSDNNWKVLSSNKVINKVNFKSLLSKMENLKKDNENKKIGRIKKYILHLKSDGKYSDLDKKLKGLTLKEKDIYLHKLYIDSKRYKNLSKQQIEDCINKDKLLEAKNYGWRFSSHNKNGQKLPDEVIKKWGDKIPTKHQIAMYKFANKEERMNMFDGSFPYYKADIRSGDIYTKLKNKGLRYERGGIITSSKYMSYDELKMITGENKITKSFYMLSDNYVARKVPVYPLFKIFKIVK